MSVRKVDKNMESANTKNNLEKKWEESQFAFWCDDRGKVIEFFKQYGLEFGDIYDHVLKSGYDKAQVVCYLLSKIIRTVKICDFLDSMREQDHDDVDVTKIFLLISHAEIAMNNLGAKCPKNELVKNFFNVIADKHKLQYKLHLSLASVDPSQVNTLGASDILYKIRCEYVHEGNYTGRVFKNSDDDPRASIMFGFRDGGRQLYGECNIMYEDFIKLYMDALAENIKIYIEGEEQRQSN